MRAEIVIDGKAVARLFVSVFLHALREAQNQLALDLPARAGGRLGRDPAEAFAGSDGRPSLFGSSHCAGSASTM
jgi:hypothetical protein